MWCVKWTRENGSRSALGVLAYGTGQAAERLANPWPWPWESLGPMLVERGWEGKAERRR